jgi:pimeloyl-ACP methyl ester carboxylesterase
MAQDTIGFLENVVGAPVHLLGCSDGATVALLVALRRPDLLRRLVLVAGVFHYDGWIPEAIDPDNEPPEFLARLYGEVSPDGAEHYPVVVAKLAMMHVEEPTLAANDLNHLESCTLVMLGDDDEVTLEHAIAMYRGLPDAELMVMPGTSHGLLVEKPISATASSSNSSPPIRCQRWRRSAGQPPFESLQARLGRGSRVTAAVAKGA